MVTRVMMSVALVVACTMTACSSVWASETPNVIIILADDLGYGDLGCTGNPVIKTPHLDTLAADAVRFTHAFATTASCSASRSVVLTGLHNHANGQYGHQHSYHHFSSFIPF